MLADRSDPDRRRADLRGCVRRVDRGIPWDRTRTAGRNGEMLRHRHRDEGRDRRRQLFGAAGISNANPDQQILPRREGAADHPGTNQIQRNIIAETLLDFENFTDNSRTS